MKNKKIIKDEELVRSKWYNAKEFNPPENLLVIVSCLNDSNILQGLQIGRLTNGKWIDYNGELMLFKPLVWQAFNTKKP